MLVHIHNKVFFYTIIMSKGFNSQNLTIEAMNNVREQKEKDETTFNRSYHKVKNQKLKTFVSSITFTCQKHVVSIVTCVS